jgi:hypothetical protein
MVGISQILMLICLGTLCERLSSSVQVYSEHIAIPRNPKTWIFFYTAGMDNIRTFLGEKNANDGSKSRDLSLKIG